MDVIKKQASKLREQVARQQQTILRQLGQLGHEGVMFDEDDMLCHEQLQKLYRSTKAIKHFQRDIVRGLEGFISTSKKQMEIVRKLAEDCCKYGIENQYSASSRLARVSSDFGTAHASMEDQRETMLGILGYQVSEPLRALINGSPLEDARHLTRSYDRTRQEFEVQAAEVIRRQTKYIDASSESYAKLKSAEKRLADLKSSMLALGTEANAAMLSVEEQQQETTFQKLLTMVDAERSYHRNVLAILEKLHSEIILEEQLEDPFLQSKVPQRHGDFPSSSDETVSNRSIGKDYEDKIDTYFVAEVIHPFDAQADGELSLEVNDYVVVRQVDSNGWSEGECQGKAGWFPLAYVEKRGRVRSSGLSEDDVMALNKNYTSVFTLSDNLSVHTNIIYNYKIQDSVGPMRICL